MVCVDKVNVQKAQILYKDFQSSSGGGKEIANWALGYQNRVGESRLLSWGRFNPSCAEVDGVLRLSACFKLSGRGHELAVAATCLVCLRLQLLCSF